MHMLMPDMLALHAQVFGRADDAPQPAQVRPAHAPPGRPLQVCLLCDGASTCFAHPVHPPCGFCLLMCTSSTMFASAVCHILFLCCATPQAVSPLTIAPPAPRKIIASSWTRALGTVRSARAMRNVCRLPNMAGTSGGAGSRKGKKLGPQLELRAASYRPGVPRRPHPERTVRELLGSFRPVTSALNIHICMGQHSCHISISVSHRPLWL